MCIKIKFPLDNNSYTDSRLPALSMVGAIVSGILLSLDLNLHYHRQSFFLSNHSNTTIPNDWILCKISYENFLCSTVSNKSNGTTQCITVSQVRMLTRLPLFSFLLQLYLLYELVSFTGRYSYILTDLYRLVILFIFDFILIGINDTSCLRQHITAGISLINLLMFGFVITLMKYSVRRDPPSSHCCRHRVQELYTNDHELNVIT